jgi:hypothetical protein
MRRNYFNNQIKKVFAMDLDPYQRYLKIKSNPNLTPDDLQEIIE